MLKLQVLPVHPVLNIVLINVPQIQTVKKIKMEINV